MTNLQNDHDVTVCADRHDAMFVGPHPHIGLQTVTWLLDGEVIHRDSLGSEQRIKPGELNAMTSGRAISHSEETPTDHLGQMHGVQLWVALPEVDRNMEPLFEHHPRLPMADVGPTLVTVLAGTFGEQTSPGTYHSPIIGLDIHFDEDGAVDLPLDPTFEHGLIVLLGEATVETDYDVELGTLLYVGPGRTTLHIEGTEGTIVLLLGGAPFGEELVMWWNFIARTVDEIRDARDAWERGDLFGTVEGFDGARIPAPPLVGLPKARGPQ